MAAYPVDNQIKPAISAIKASGPLSKIGNLYTVELLPDEDEFLDWDKPLSEQSEKVKAAIQPFTKNLGDDIFPREGTLQPVHC